MKKALRIVKVIGMLSVSLALAVLTSGLSYRVFMQHRVAKSEAISSPNGINSLERAPIGGIEQWIEVRGKNVDNPILLVIHGGPGLAFIPLANAFQEPWEQHFTVVEWDQR